MSEEQKNIKHTSKIMLAAVIVAGFIMLFMGLFQIINNLIGYGLLLGATIWNRLDSRAKSYRASWSVGNISGTIECAGDNLEGLTSGETPPGGAHHRPDAPDRLAGGQDSVEY